MKEMTKPKKLILIFALLLALAALVFCGIRSGKTPEEKMSESTAASAGDALQTAALLSDAAEAAFQNGTAQRIILSDNGSTAVHGVLIRQNTVTVVSPGVYAVSGSLTEGQLAVDCFGTVTLILNGVTITNSTDAALRVSDADHALIYLPAGSENELVSGTEREITAAGENAESETASGAALYARDDLSIAGTGKLTVSGYINNAIATTDRLTVLGGEMELTAVGNGLKGKDSVTVLGGVIRIQSGNDGVKADDGAGGGDIDIRGGEISIVSLGDGMDAEKNLTVLDGRLTVTAGDISSMNTETASPSLEEPPGGMPGMNGGMVFPGGQGGERRPPDGQTPPDMPGGMGEGGNGQIPPEMPDMNGEPPKGTPPERSGQTGGFDRQTENVRGQGGMRGGFPERFDRERSDDPDSGVSKKGLKSGGDLAVLGGGVTVTSQDDCIHANGNITVTGGTFLLSTADDGFHADGTLTLADGDITVSQSKEGIEGHFIFINGGSVSVTASDDGINAGGGDSSPFGGRFGAASDDAPLPLLKISGGTLRVNANGDGLDSNGDLVIEGGTVLVDGPANGGNGALDSGAENGGRILCNGGTVLAIGSSGMAETFGGDSAQCSFIQNYSKTLPAGTCIRITDENGQTVFEHVSAKSFDSIVFSSPALTLGKTYTVTAGDQTDEITMESVSNGASSGFTVPGAFGGHGRR